MSSLDSVPWFFLISPPPPLPQISDLFSPSNKMSIATYEEVLDLPNHPEKVLIDVRGTDELAATGQIPTSINIPRKYNYNRWSHRFLNKVASTFHNSVEQVGKAFSPETNTEDFQQRYGVPKPASDSYIIVSCRTGRRSQMAIDTITALGYTK